VTLEKLTTHKKQRGHQNILRDHAVLPKREPLDHQCTAPSGQARFPRTTCAPRENQVCDSRRERPLKWDTFFRRKAVSRQRSHENECASLVCGVAEGPLTGGGFSRDTHSRPATARRARGVHPPTADCGSHLGLQSPSLPRWPSAQPLPTPQYTKVKKKSTSLTLTLTCTQSPTTPSPLTHYPPTASCTSDKEHHHGRLRSLARGNDRDREQVPDLFAARRIHGSCDW
jgi:hypothetical protein